MIYEQNVKILKNQARIAEILERDTLTLDDVVDPMHAHNVNLPLVSRSAVFAFDSTLLSESILKDFVSIVQIINCSIKLILNGYDINVRYHGVSFTYNTKNKTFLQVTYFRIKYRANGKVVNLMMADIFDPRLCFQIQQTKPKKYPDASLADITSRREIRLVKITFFSTS